MKKIISIVMVAAMIAALAFTVSADDTATAPTDGLLAHFTFDDAETGLTGNGAKATTAKAVMGEKTSVDDPVDGKPYDVVLLSLEDGGDPTITDDAAIGDGAYQFDGSQFLKVTKEDGSGLLDGVSSLTISYWAKHDTTTAQWPFFATPNLEGGPKSQTYPKETYIGVLENTNVSTELYNSPVNENKRTYSAANTLINFWPDEWHHITVVIDTDNEDPEQRKITIYDQGDPDGKSAKIEIEQHKVSEILGTDYSVFLGFASWGYNDTGATYHEGEWGTLTLDDMYIYGRALSADEVAALVAATPKKEDPVETEAPGKETDAPSDETQAPSGNNNTTEKPADGTETTSAPADEGGCGSTLGAAAAVVALTAVFGCAIVKKH